VARSIWISGASLAKSARASASHESGTGSPPVGYRTGVAGDVDGAPGPRGRRFDRRQFISLVAASGAGALLASGTAGAATRTVDRAAAMQPAGSDLGAIEHVIFLMM
jgi:hypothetical protein